MNKRLLMLLLSAVGFAAQSQPYETARVIATTPLQSQAPQQLCSAGPDGTTVICTPQALPATLFLVEYELGGKRYSVQMPQDPGPTLLVQVAPVPATVSTSVSTTVYAAPVYLQAPIYGPPIYVAPPYAYPYRMAPYGYGYHPPIGLSIGLGYHWHR